MYIYIISALLFRGNKSERKKDRGSREGNSKSKRGREEGKKHMWKRETVSQDRCTGLIDKGEKRDEKEERSREVEEREEGRERGRREGIGRGR